MTPLRVRVGVWGVGGATHLCRASWQSRGSETLRRLEGGLAPEEEEEERAGREK